MSAPKVVRVSFRDDMVVAIMRGQKTVTRRVKRPRVRPGDTIAVCEGIRRVEDFSGHIVGMYSADGAYACESWPWKMGFLPGIYMPRALTRTLLLCTAVDLGKLGDVDEDEARREGFASVREFRIAWNEINGPFLLDDEAWAVRFTAGRSAETSAAALTPRVQAGYTIEEPKA